jgi:hypothetical protein
VDPASSPYAQNLQQIYDTENPELLELIDRQFQQESGNQQFDANGQPLTSSRGRRSGIAQVMPETGPEAAALAGVPWDPKMPIGTIRPIISCSASLICPQQLRKYDGDVARALAAYNAGPGRVDRGACVGGRLAFRSAGRNARLCAKGFVAMAFVEIIGVAPWVGTIGAATRIAGGEVSP